MLHVAQISFFVDRERRTPERLLIDWHSLPAVACAAASAGNRVTVVQASHLEGLIRRDGVDYHFVAPREGGARLTRSARFVALLRDLGADVFHVHGLGFAREVIGLRALAPGTPILLQDHADGPPRLWRRGPWKRGAAAADGIAFCARAQAEPFQRRGLLATHHSIFEIPESTSSFTPGDQAAARVATGLHGDPAILWVGHLDDNKDPLTVLDGVAAATPGLPGLRLWLCHGNAPRLGAVQERIRGDERLRDRVTLLGRVAHERVQQLMRAADLFVLGSHREGSGYSVIEALASGLMPVVTDIPSFRVLVGTGADAAGALWPCGQAARLAAALAEVAARPAATRRTQALARFERELSALAVGRKLRDAYLQLSANPRADRKLA